MKRAITYGPDIQESAELRQTLSGWLILRSGCLRSEQQLEKFANKAIVKESQLKEIYRTYTGMVPRGHLGTVWAGGT